MLATSLLLAASLLHPPGPPAATQLIAAFNPSLADVSRPSKVQRPVLGMEGQAFLIASSGEFTYPPGDLYVTLTTEARGKDGKELTDELFHFGSKMLAKLKTNDARFGDCYAVFLPWPPNWPTKAQIKVSAQFVPKGKGAKKLDSVQQTVLVDKAK